MTKWQNEMSHQIWRDRWQRVGAVLAAHTVMLGEAGLFDEVAVAGLVSAIDDVSSGVPTPAPLTAMLAEFDARLDAQTPAALMAASRLGRGTADVVATVARLELREELLLVALALHEIRSLLVEMAAVYRSSLMPLAEGSELIQPTTIGHFLAATAEPLNRANGQLTLAIDMVNQAPMGALAGVSTGLDIDPAFTAETLGFTPRSANSLDAVISIDWLTGTATAMQAIVLPLSRLLDEFWLWMRIDPATIRFGTLHAPSDLPQVRHPHELDERLLQVEAVLDSTTAVTRRSQRTRFWHGGDYDALFELAERCVTLTGEFLKRCIDLLRSETEINLANLAQRASRSRLTSSDLAEFLMLQAELAPAPAHEIARLVVAELIDSNLELSAMTPQMVDRVALTVIGQEIGLEPEDISRYLAPRRFIARRAHAGGPAAEPMESWIASQQERLLQDREQLQQITDRVGASNARLAEIVRSARTFNAEN